jgi:N-acetylglucosamine kinase-like BadF-type ATPase
LIAVARQLDGRSDPTLITNLLQKEFHILSQDDLITQIYRNHFEIPAVAKLVLQAAEQGDAQAKRIISEEVSELLCHIRTMEKKIAVQKLEVSFIGSLIVKDNVFSQLLRERIKSELPNVCLKEAKSSPAFGAVLLALKRMNSIANAV